jgi:uncharacterized protein YabN with tetrapyrrole methylase and pyrophosphatase domain
MSLKQRIHAFLHPEESLKSLQKVIGEWSSRKIPGATWQGNLQHLRNELDELEEELVIWSHLCGVRDEKAQVEYDIVHDRLRKEMADIVILMAHLSRLTRVDLTEAVIDKMEINFTRTWSKPDPITGVIHHV